MITRAKALTYILFGGLAAAPFIFTVFVLRMGFHTLGVFPFLMIASMISGLIFLMIGAIAFFSTEHQHYSSQEASNARIENDISRTRWVAEKDILK